MPTLIRALFMLLLTCLAAWGGTVEQKVPLQDPEVERWLDGPNRRDFDWKVRIFGPWLTFQQRYVVEAEVVLPVHKLVRAGVSFSDLRFVVKLKDRRGHWLPGRYHSLFAPPPDLAKAREILLYTHFFVRPGSYAVVMAVYDGRTQRANVWKRQLEVTPPKEDSLPEAGRDLPEVEFPSGEGEPSPSGPARLYLPVRNQRPVRLDVVVNLSLSDATNTRNSQAPDWVYRSNAGILLQIGKILSQLELGQGCVRFSAIDILRQKVFADRRPVTEVNWGELFHSVATLERTKIDVRVLQEERATAGTFARFLEQVSADTVACGMRDPKPGHVLLVISDAFLFPGNTQMAAVRRELMPGAICYYLQMDPITGGRWDQIGRVLSPLHPKHWEFSDATRFRKVIAELIADLERIPPNGAQVPPPP